MKTAAYSQVKAIMQDMAGAYAAAKRQDASEAQRWWGAELWARVSNWEYHQQKKQFDDAVTALTQRADDALEASWRVLNSRFAPHEPAPTRLEADAAGWRKRYLEVDGIKKQMQELTPIPGWSGTSAETYDQAVSVQIAAVEELEGVMLSCANGALRGSLLNKALFALAHIAIDESYALADVDLPGGDNYFYLRTARWGDILIQLPDILKQIADLDNVQEALTQLRTQLGEAVSMAQLLGVGEWPTGLDAVGTLPADTGSAVNGNPVGQTDYDVPDSNTPGVCTGGARRD